MRAIYDTRDLLVITAEEATGFCFHSKLDKGLISEY